jgi:hypothetical protein
MCDSFCCSEFLSFLAFEFVGLELCRLVWSQLPFPLDSFWRFETFYWPGKFTFCRLMFSSSVFRVMSVNPLKPELNPSAQRCLTRFFTGDFVSWTVHFVNIRTKKQQMQQLFIQFIMYAISYMLRHYIAISGSDLRSPRTTSLDTTRSSTIFYRLLLNWTSLRSH